MRLPHCDKLFESFFSPWYDDESRKCRIYKATRPDLERLFEPGTPVNEVQALDAKARTAVRQMIRQMVEAARGDWPPYLGVSPPVSLDWVAAFDAFYTRKKIKEVIERSDPSQFDNEYVIVTCEFGAVLGEVLRKQSPDVEWLYDWPYWESALYHGDTGTRVNVFHWAVKKMSAYGVDDGFADKLQACVGWLQSNSA
jgi:hypothetical protein